ncbi:MAG: hypothetical protein ABUT39_04865 [Acidobacteriota bacterium]
MLNGSENEAQPPSRREQLLRRMHPVFREVDAGFQKYIATVTAHPDWDDDKIEKELRLRGVGFALAQELVSFVPMAFGREVVAELGVTCSEDFRLHEMSDDSEQDLPLADEMAFAWAKAIVDEYRTPELNPVFKRIASRSAELNAVNNALNAGMTEDQLRETRLAPSLVYLRRAKKNYGGPGTRQP